MLVVTEAWLYDDVLYQQVEQYKESIFSYLRKHHICFKSSRDYFVLVLDLRRSGKYGYYFVDHMGQRLFWFDDYDFSWAAGEVHVEHADSIIGMEMKRHYWRHNEKYPHLYVLTEEDLEEIDNLINFPLGGTCGIVYQCLNGH